MSQRCGFHNLIVRASQAAIGQMTQLSSCNNLHGVEGRTCRWLLGAVDRVGRPEFALSWGLLARRLDVPPAAVLGAVCALKRMGAIEYIHGSIRILNRETLLRRACNCHAVITAMYSRLVPELFPASAVNELTSRFHGSSSQP